MLWKADDAEYEALLAAYRLRAEAWLCRCGEPLVGLRCDAIYCGKRCRQQASRERQRLARAARARNLCPCSATLSGRRSDAVYHSDSCRLRAWRKRRRTDMTVLAQT
jgi:hypothetical protein